MITPRGVSISYVIIVSPTRNVHENSNSKWVARDLKLAFNRVPIQEIYFGLTERHNSNMGILSPKNLFAERIFF